MIKTVKCGDVKAEDANKEVNRIFVIDCSGSMYGELPAIRHSIKNKLPQLTNIGDTISIIWFSGSGESGIVQEGIEVNSVKDFTKVNSVIDKFLKPQGLTGFKDPILLAKEVSDRLKKKNSNSVSHVFFQTDGCDNQNSKKDIIDSMIKLSESIDTMTIVEYGWYCNRKLLTEMADEIGANLLFTDSFDQLDSEIEKSLTKVIKGGKKRKVDLGELPKFGFAFAFDDSGDCFSFIPDADNTISVPESIQEVKFINSDKIVISDETSMYEAIYVLAQRRMGDEIIGVLENLGDVYLVDLITNCYTAQQYIDFQNIVKDMIFDTAKRFPKGKDLSYVPKADAFCLKDFLDIVTMDDGNKFYPYHPEYKYSVVSAKMIDVNKAEVELLNARLAQTNDPDEIESIQSSIEELSNKFKYEFTPRSKDDGVSINSIVYNKSRANISISYSEYGFVKLDKHLDVLPEQFPTKQYRNRNIVTDGIVHSSCKSFPLSITQDTFDTLQANGMLLDQEWGNGKVFLFDLTKLPVINRKMVQKVSGVGYFSDIVEDIKFSFQQKVAKDIIKVNSAGTETERSQRLSELYSDDSILQYLSSVGITDTGFAPKKKRAEPTDEYTAKELNVSVKSFSKAPSLNDYLTKVRKINESAKAKFNPSEALYDYYFNKVSKYHALAVDKKLSDDDINELNRIIDFASQNIKQIRNRINSDNLSIIIGKTWFNDVSDGGVYDLHDDETGFDFICMAELVDKIIKI